MTDQQLDSAAEPASPGAWSRARQWSREHRTPLLVLGAGVTAATAAVALRARGGSGEAAQFVGTTVKEAVESAVGASTRVAAEFDALGRDYTMAAMDRSVVQAFRRHQRWSEEELAVLRDASKTALEKALELHRTFNGVRAKAIAEGASSLAP